MEKGGRSENNDERKEKEKETLEKELMKGQDCGHDLAVCAVLRVAAVVPSDEPQHQRQVLPPSLLRILLRPLQTSVGLDQHIRISFSLFLSYPFLLSSPSLLPPPSFLSPPLLPSLTQIRSSRGGCCTL